MVFGIAFVSLLRYRAVIVISFDPDLGSGDLKCHRVPSRAMEKIRPFEAHRTVKAREVCFAL
ncbi:MAG: hypothetical protein WB763_22390 [Terriglobia bacterium]|jgi:hypothetical protein